MLNYSHFRASIPPHAGDISSSACVCFTHSPPSLCLPHVRSLSLLSWSFAHFLCHLYFVNPSLFHCVSSQLTFCWWHTVYLYSSTYYFSWNISLFIKRALEALEECICSERIFDDLVTHDGPKWIHHLVLIWGDQLWVSKWKGPGIRSWAGC